MVLSITVLSLVSLWPSVEAMTGGRIPCPDYIQDRVKFRLVAGLDLRPGEDVLDVGCGQGACTVPAARAVAPGGSVIGIDVAPAMVEGARLSLDRARRLLIAPRRHLLSFREHTAIVTAIAAGDPPAARSAMAAHLDSVMQELEDFARVNPALFDDGE